MVTGRDMRSVRQGIAWLGLLWVVFGLVGCGGSGLSSAGGDVQEDPAVRFLNASPGSPAVDFILNEGVAAAGLTYLSSTTGFVRIPFITEEDDGYDVSVAPSAGGEEYDSIGGSFARDINMLVVAYGLADPGTEFMKRMQLMFVPVSSQAVVGDRARLLVAHTLVRAAGADPVTLKLQTVDPGDPFSQDNPQFSINNLAFGSYNADSNTLEVDSGTLTFQARRADVDGVNVVAQATATLRSGATYLVLIVGQEEAADPALLPQIRFIELVPIN